MSSEVRQALIVDDEPQVRAQLTRALESNGFACEAAADGAEALTRFHTGHHQLVVTDLRMPTMNGHQLATQLMGASPRPRVVVFTGVMEPAIVRDLMVRGVDDVITKPCDVKVFATKMTALFEGQQWRKAELSRQATSPESTLQEQRIRELEAALEHTSRSVSGSVRELLRSAGEILPNPTEELSNYVRRLRERRADSQLHLEGGLEFSSPVTCLPVDRNSVPISQGFKAMGIELSSSRIRILHTRQKRNYLALRWPSLIASKSWRYAIVQVESCRPLSHLYEIVADFVVLDQ
jgi:DNA-binding response OmpR family regulator